MKLKCILTAVFAVVLLMGCSMGANGGMWQGSVSNGDASKATIKKDVKIGKFNKIEASSGIQVVFTQGSHTGVAKVATTPSAEKYLKIGVDGGTLEISYASHKENIYGPTIVSVQAPDLTEIELSSAAFVQINGNLKIRKKLDIELSSAASVSARNVTGEELDIELSSASAVNISNVNLDVLKIDLSSASTCSIENVTAVRMNIDTSSSAKCDVKSFNGTEVDADSSSASTVRVNGIVAEKVKGEAHSGAEVILEGKCSTLVTDSGSGGSVSARRLKCDKSNKSGKGKEPSKRSGGSSMPRNPSR